MSKDFDVVCTQGAKTESSLRRATCAPKRSCSQTLGRRCEKTGCIDNRPAPAQGTADAPKPIQCREEKCLNLVSALRRAGGAFEDALRMFILTGGVGAAR
jgi:hypothetical protein